MNTYLLQPGKINNISSSEITGIDSLVTWKDLYAAEFEMGALPDTLKRMIANLETYTFAERRYKDTKENKLVIFCKTPMLEEVNHEIDEIVKGKKVFKNLNSMVVKNHMKGETSDSNDLDFFWDIRNDYFFFFGTENKEKVITALNCLKEKWAEPEKVSFFSKIFKKRRAII